MSGGAKGSYVTDDHIIGLPKASNCHGNRIPIVPAGFLINNRYATSNSVGKESGVGIKICTRKLSSAV